MFEGWHLANNIEVLKKYEVVELKTTFVSS